MISKYNNDKIILIVSNFRTGSTSLCHSLGKKYNIPYFVEPNNGTDRWKKFIDQYNTPNSRYVLKIIQEQLEYIPEYKDLLNSDCFKIKLTRRDLIDNITSFYISKIRETWYQTPDDVVTPYYIPINRLLMEESIITITRNNNMLHSSTIQFDEELVYEDLGIIDSDRFCKTTQPKNYVQVKKIIKEMMSNEKSI